jgi:hypothetical protein
MLVMLSMTKKFPQNKEFLSAKIQIQIFLLFETFTSTLDKISLYYVIFGKILLICIGYLATNLASSCEFRVYSMFHAFRGLVMPSEISMAK